jgi:mitochondrial enoyl-[acyl-carrier protein] reductase / trans-2-enoyl-CoA reductase
MKALRCGSFGVPWDVAELSDEPDSAAPGPSQVTVHTVAMPIHPADLLALEGRYGARRPALPAYCGTDGVGRVSAVGEEASHLKVGDLVPLLFAGVATWRESFTVEAKWLFALPEGDSLALSVVGLNALTAWAMLKGVVDLPAGAWVVQNAASSSVGHACLHLAGRMNFRLIHVVRSAAAAERMKAAGAVHVLMDDDDLASRVTQLTGADLPRLAIDAVGGSATARLAACTANGGTVLNYGLLSGEPNVIGSADLLFRQVTLRGFWLKAWLRGQPMDTVRQVYAELAALASANQLGATVAATYPLHDYRAALKHAASDSRKGKVLFVGGA